MEDMRGAGEYDMDDWAFDWMETELNYKEVAPTFDYLGFISG